MILLHCYFWVATEYGYINFSEGSRSVEWMKYFMVFGFFPLMLPVTAGCSFRFFLSPDEKLPRTNWLTLLRVIAMSVLICFAGFVMNALSVGLRGALGWNVLQLVAVSYMVIALILTVLPVAAVAVLATAVLIFTPTLRTLFRSESYWSVSFFGTQSAIGWPVCPWFVAVAYGFLLTHVYLRYRDRRGFNSLLTVTGIVLVVIPLIAGQFLPIFDRFNLMGGQLFNPPPVFILAVLGVATLTLAAALKIASWARWSRYGLIASYSKGILFVYVAHVVAGTRLYEFSRRYVQQGPLTAQGGPVTGPLLGIGFTLVVLAIGWLAGYVAIQLFGDRVIRVRLRRALRSQ